MMKMIALIGQVNAEVTSRSRRLSLSGQVCLSCLVFAVSVSALRCVGLCGGGGLSVPTVFSFPVLTPAPPTPKRRLTVMVVNYNYISVAPPVSHKTSHWHSVTGELSVSSDVINFHLN